MAPLSNKQKVNIKQTGFKLSQKNKHLRTNHHLIYDNQQLALFLLCGLFILIMVYLSKL